MMFQQFFFLVFLCFIFPSNSNRISLAGDDWTITNNVNYTAQGRVPGTIHTILFNASQIPDPYTGYNDVDLRFLVYSDWVFKKKFNLSSDFLASNQIKIHLDQIDTVANISINTCLIGKTDNMFIRYIYEVPSGCLHAENEIQIDFQSPITYALEKANAYNDSVPPNCTVDVQHGECHVQFIRKEPCSFSWDWGPAFAPIGIPRDLFLEGLNNSEIVIELESVNLAGYNKDTQIWQVDVILSSDNDQFTSNLSFLLQHTAWTFQTSPVFNRTLTISLSISHEHVLLWWPNGYGDQPLYNLSVSNNGQAFGNRYIGFRTVELIQDAYGGGINGTSFYFAINSKPIFIKGSNWIPSDSFQERVSDEKLTNLLLSAQLANMNMLRVWGGGIYERQLFYELADKFGIMLWHDFMFACSLYPVDEPFLTNVHNEIIHQVQRLQSHSSIVLWSGNNENEAAVAQNWYHVPPERMNKTKDDYRKLYVDTVMSAVKEVDKGNNRPFVTSSPSNGLETIAENYIATDPQNPLYGDVHYYGFQEDSWDPTTYPIARFLSETGVQSLPSLDTWYQATTNDSDLNLNSSFVLHREHKFNDTIVILTHIESNLPLPVTNDAKKNFVHLIYLSQINQAMTLKSISDLCRVHSSKDMIDAKTGQGHTMGLMYWQINDIWQAPTWATIEYGLKWKLAHYYVRHMYAPVYPIATLTPYLASTTDESAQISLYVVNELLTGTAGSLRCWVHTFDTFTPRLSFGGDASFNAPGVQHLGNFQYSSIMRRVNCTDSSKCIIHCLFDNNQDQIRQTLFLNRPKTYSLSNPNLQVKSVSSTSSTDFHITVTADRPALFVWLDTTTNVTGYFSRNGFNMFEPVMNVTFHSWTPVSNLAVTVTSLFDVTQP